MTNTLQLLDRMCFYFVFNAKTTAASLLLSHIKKKKNLLSLSSHYPVVRQTLVDEEIPATIATVCNIVIIQHDVCTTDEKVQKLLHNCNSSVFSCSTFSNLISIDHCFQRVCENTR